MNDEERRHETRTENIEDDGQAQREDQGVSGEQASKRSSDHSQEEYREAIGELSFFDDDEIEQFRSRWDDIQLRFVDSPQASVKNANELVNDTINNVADTFAQQQAYLEKQWNSGEQATTEDLRVALKHYRYFFDRLLDLETGSS